VRVLVTGAAGFLGSAVTGALERAGFIVRIADTAARLQSCADLSGEREVWTYDFSAQAPPRGMLEGVDALVHLGCTTNPAHSMAAMAFDADSNIGPSIRLFEAAAGAGIGRVVFSSSGGTIYGAPARLPVDENAATRPLSAYGVSKLAIENYLAIQPGLLGVSLRVANPYGAFQLRGAAIGVIARYLLAVSRGEPLEVWGDGSVVRDYIAVADVADAFVAAVGQPGLVPGPYNIGTGSGTSIAGIIAMIFDATGRQVPVVHRPARGYDVPAIVLDCGLFSKRTGWRAGTDLKDGIAELWEGIARPAVRAGGP
jgi:UDP-glucose 4-epimerase